MVLHRWAGLGRAGPGWAGLGRAGLGGGLGWGGFGKECVEDMLQRWMLHMRERLCTASGTSARSAKVDKRTNKQTRTDQRRRQFWLQQRGVSWEGEDGERSALRINLH